MPRRRSPKPSDRPQAPETWGVGAVQLRIWITPADAAPRRPFSVMVLDLENGWMLGAELFEHTPTPEDARAVLRAAITKPLPGAGRPRRPERILFDDSAQAEALAATLAEWGIACETEPLPMLAEIAREMETQLHGGEPEHPGLLSVPGVTPELAGGMFAAAAEFYRATPWVALDNSQAFALRFPARGGREWIASVMGNGGVEYGLAIYKSWDRFAQLFTGAVDNPMELLPVEGQIGLVLGDASTLPFADLDALEKYGWEVAGEQAYPLAAVYQLADEVVRRPTREEVAFLEAALRAIPPALEEHMRPDGQGDFAPFKATIAVPTHAGERRVVVRYPAGKLALESQPVARDIWEAADEDDEGPPAFDRRGMEAVLAQLAGDLGADPAVRDPELAKAQQLMYQAWEETNPAKRLSLAHEALATSPDCADAYVLLAEEEAGTLARAEEMYRQGVAAGERGLGEDYFAANTGHFWGLLETRPYMRARAGLANTLWSLHRPEEAAEHYRALLVLNPNDNQGIRYSLLDMLLELGRDADAVTLLKQYDDGMAEWLYTFALMEFRQSGPGKAADRRLRAALKQNKHVPAYLAGKKRIPIHLPSHLGFGDETEAMHYAHGYLNYWRRTPGAVQWLQEKARLR